MINVFARPELLCAFLFLLLDVNRILNLPFAFKPLTTAAYSGFLFPENDENNFVAIEKPLFLLPSFISNR